MFQWERRGQEEDEEEEFGNVDSTKESNGKMIITSEKVRI
jgi:hypothetical protein